jgi:DNA modification methylase
MIRDNPMADPEHRIIHTDARRSGEPDQSIHVAISSPPYWGLRAYGTDPQVWGGDPACEHEFAARDGYAGHRGERGQVPQTKWQANKTYPQHKADTAQGFCTKCAAWRGELGQEPTPDLFVAHLVEVFREVKRVLRDDGCCWVNLGDTYCATTRGAGGKGKQHTNQGSVLQDRNWQIPDGLKPKDLVGVPFLFAMAMRADGWFWRSICPWVKRSSMPESTRDRPGVSTEYWMMFTKSDRYFYDLEAVKLPLAAGSAERYKYAFGGAKNEHIKDNINPTAVVGMKEATDGRNRRTGDWWFDSVKNLDWDEPVGMLTGPDGLPLGFDCVNNGYGGAHFAMYPIKMVEPIIKACTSEKGVCPHCGSPWERVVEKTRVATRPGTDSKVMHLKATQQYLDRPDGYERSPDDMLASTLSGVVGNRDPQRHVTETKTIGWEQGCECPPHEPVPATVYDPFTGACSTGIAAMGLGRRFVGTEVNQKYINDVAHPRVAEWRRVQRGLPAKPPVIPKGEGLFELAEDAA